MTERAPRCVFLLTDYGQIDEFAGVLRAVVARLAPGAPIVDLTHDVPAFDVRAGALTLERATPHLGPGVICGVVDPGVAGARRALAIETRSADGPRHLVGPDNGLLLFAADLLGGAVSAVILSPEAVPGATVTETWASTFDGRDLFAPTAAALWNGTGMTDLGSPVEPGRLVRIARPALFVVHGTIETEVQWVDRFGNVQFSARDADATAAGLGESVAVEIGTDSGNKGLIAKRVRAFEEVRAGEVGILVDANGHLALAGNRVSAALTLGLACGQLVTLRQR
ncbi:MAG: SAM-dependent chlorinase/fluorinase [Acidimicrobiales bacterium]